jgi:NAD(P)H-nitrite reductase large subunit
MPLRDEAFYTDQKIDLRLKTEVVSLDPKARTVTVKGGGAVAYDILILASGGEPNRPTIPGLEGGAVHLLRSLEDARALASAAQNAKVAVVIGASFIGLEAAASLKKLGLDVHVVAPETVPFAKVLGEGPPRAEGRDLPPRPPGRTFCRRRSDP